MWYVAGLIVLGLMLLAMLGLARMAWRIWRGEEEAEAGGSLGDQILGRRNRPRAK